MVKLGNDYGPGKKYYCLSKRSALMHNMQQFAKPAIMHAFSTKSVVAQCQINTAYGQIGGHIWDKYC